MIETALSCESLASGLNHILLPSTICSAISAVVCEAIPAVVTVCNLV